MQNSTLLTQGLVPEVHAHHTDHLELTIAHIAMAFWVCLANGSQIVNILLTPAIRRQPKNMLVVNVCLCEVIIGGFLCPLYSDSLLQGTWRHNPVTCIVYEATFYGQVCVSTLAVFFLLVERLYYLLSPHTRINSCIYCLTLLMVVFPWILGAALVAPLVVYGSIAKLNQGSQSCQILWKPRFQTVTIFVSFFCPAFLAMVMAVFMVIFYVMHPVTVKDRHEVPEPDRQLIKESVRVGLLSSLTSVMLQFPFFIVLLQEIFCQRDASSLRQCGLSEKTWSVVMLVAMLKPGITPFVWLAYSDVRSGFRLLCVRRSERRHRRRISQAEDALAYLSHSGPL
ncbi:unnamed protein product [Lymnaea stagnalis]|uniref:G-protein coupled receptors family 1 profile domain-containing protein n=1 Tax=Lymnaea stagnalis TaxID=6523 RepID=A0AAV2HD35_LYMST